MPNTILFFCKSPPCILLIFPVAACAVGNGHAIHAMVLDCVKEENPGNHGKKLFFVFKNTDKNNKQMKIQVGTEFRIFTFILNYLYSIVYTYNIHVCLISYNLYDISYMI